MVHILSCKKQLVFAAGGGGARGGLCRRSACEY